jgi:hypothetical protein
MKPSRQPSSPPANRNGLDGRDRVWACESRSRKEMGSQFALAQDLFSYSRLTSCLLFWINLIR